MTSFSQTENAFSQVPTELWDQIFSNPEIDNNTLLNLALVSMSVYHKCHFAFLARLGLKKETLERRIELSLGGPLRERNVLYVLSLPYIVDRTEELICNFPHGVQSLPGFQYRIHRAQAVLSQLRSIKRVRLTFSSAQSTHEPSHQVQASFRGSPDAFRLFFDTILQTGAEVLEIHDEGIMSLGLLCPISLRPCPQTMAVPPSPPRARILSTLRKLLPSLHHETGRRFISVVGGRWEGDWNTLAVDVFSDVAKSKTRLRQIDIKCTKLSTIPLAKWIYAAASISPVTGLSLSNMADRVPLDERPLFLSRLPPRVVPNATHLNIYVKSVPPAKALNQYLTAFSHLTHLRITHGCSRFHQPFACPILPHLIDLGVSGRWLQEAFPLEQQPRYLPKLCTVRVVLSASTARDLTFNQTSLVREKLKAISQRRHTPFEVVLEVALCSRTGCSTLCLPHTYQERLWNN
ncbi:hypothetical protein BKA70DRAFT_36264 [Coprinopsis sp. MPI-PUGE-AT-0042]|nr:hypothetical protein BKA70DRAFT_36264 [Coprinopsis sp. MPI-PUGE-AT-0042]